MSSIINAGTSGVTITGSTTTTLSLATNGTTAMTIDAAQNVAFANPVTFSGNIDANGNLNFIGTGRRITGDFSNATVANRVLFQSSTTNGGTEVGVMPNGTGTSAGWNVYGTPTTAATTVARFDIANNTETRLLSGRTDASVSFIPLTFYTGGSERMRLDTSGNLGIGTTSPVTRLHVLDALSGGQFIVANSETNSAEKYGTFATQHYTNAEEPALGFAVQSSSSDNNILIGGALGEFNAATTIKFYTAANNTTTSGTQRMTIDSSGNVGIGTASPSYKLDVSGVTRSSGSFNPTNSSWTSAAFRAQGSFGGGLSFIDGSAGYGIWSQDSGGTFAIGQGTTSGALTERMRINSSGNVGIGTASPGEKLAVVGNIVAGNTGSTSDGYIDIDSGGAGKVRITRTGTGATDSSMVFSTTFSTLQERMRITSGGNVGIGTTSPAQRLHVVNSASAETIPLRISNDIAGIAIATAGAQFVAHGVEFARIVGGQNQDNTFADGNLRFFTRGSESVAERMRITSAGNVGIGTTSPSTALQVSGTITTTGLTVSNTIAGSINGTSNYANNLTQGFNSNWNTDFAAAPAGSTILRGDTSTGSTAGGPGGTWWFQQNMRHTNASNVWGVQVAWGWEDNANILRTRNVQGGNYGAWVTYLNSANYTSYITGSSLKSQTFTGSGTFTVPAGITSVWVTMVGGGSGGAASPFGNGAGGGAAGAYMIKRAVSVTPGAGVAVTIGGGGSGSPDGVQGSGSAGGATSFGSVTCSGAYQGGGIGQQINPQAGTGGATGGARQSNWYGFSLGGLAGYTVISGVGYGGGAGGLYGNGGVGGDGYFATSAAANSGGGGGGGGAQGGNGGSGMVIVEWLG